MRKWKYEVIDCLLTNLKSSMNTRKHLKETKKSRFKIKPMGLVTYEDKGKLRCVLAYGWKERK